MTKYGNIRSYDTGKGSGTIAPEQGGAVLEFGKSDLQQEASTPKSGERFSYETKQVDGGKECATNLRQQEQAVRQGGKQREQARQQQG
ncbi:cold-shock protein [Qipengyuania sp. 1NDW9]|uniref:Cold-shock protein n=1 Tax=Qipengyuania xiapuensis TaxID=2867236 RepID=A0ABX8ZVF2_9SPHN|nr:cold-shock protein [Qipengyuania xiapuensis]MBX7492850.1 cold-shock protein [Qipengyuania xiapuensis]QZD92981.1 cold-shock protein [Qipengyuania xiapuensis]